MSKLERFNEEEEFISAHNIENDITERALLYSLQIVNEALSRIDELKGIIIKIAEY